MPPRLQPKRRRQRSPLATPLPPPTASFTRACLTPPCRSFPDGPWAAGLQELCVDSCLDAPNGGPAMLPPLPALRSLSYHANARLTLAHARALLDRAPQLQELCMPEGSRFITAPARKALAAAGVAAGPRRLP